MHADGMETREPADSFEKLGFSPLLGIGAGIYLISKGLWFMITLPVNWTC